MADPVRNWALDHGAGFASVPLQAHQPVDGWQSGLCAGIIENSGLILSSSLAVQALAGDVLGRQAIAQTSTVLAIGAKTAQAWRDAGGAEQSIAAVFPTAQDLVAAVISQGAFAARYLYLAARETAADVAQHLTARGITCEKLTLYATQALSTRQLSASERLFAGEAANLDKIRILLFYAARSLTTCLEQTDWLLHSGQSNSVKGNGLKPPAPITVICLSERIAAQLADATRAGTATDRGKSWRAHQRLVAPRPDSDGMIAALSSMLARTA